MFQRSQLVLYAQIGRAEKSPEMVLSSAQVISLPFFQRVQVVHSSVVSHEVEKKDVYSHLERNDCQSEEEIKEKISLLDTPFG